MKRIIPIIIFFSLSTISNSQWNTVSPFPAWGIYDVCFIDENEGWIYDGDILHTTDGGSSWEELYSSCGHSFNSLFFIDSQNGWLTGVKEIFKTTDGGKTWESQYYSSMTVFNSICFTDELNGSAVGVYHWGDLDTYEEMVETHDGGITWESKGNINNRNQGEYTDVYFSDNDHGWILGTVNGQGIVERTTNGGISWVGHNVHNWMTSVFFADSLNGWIVGPAGSIYHSDDGGINWVQQVSGTNLDLNDLAFSTPENGMALGEDGLLLKTSDSGLNWQITYLTDPEFPYNDLDRISMPDDLNICVVCGSGAIYHTVDGGNLWQLQSSKIVKNPLESLYFTNQENGWLVGSAGNIISTHDGGMNWQVQNVGITDLIDVCFTDVDNGWIVGDAGAIFQTSNSGADWQYQNPPPFENLLSVCFVDNLHGWCSGEGGTILKTVDGGLNWVQINAGLPDYSHVMSVFFTDVNKGWAAVQYAADGHHILHSDDGGETWTSQLNNAYMFYSLYFLDSLNGWAAGTAVMHTSDGGVNWEMQDPPGNDDFRDIFFIDQNYGWATPKPRYTTDGGATWQAYTCEELWNPYVTDIFFTDQENGWAIHGSLLYHTDNGGLVSLPDNKNIAGDHHSCYPNPFTDKFTIDFTLEKPGHVLVDIYDIYGRKVIHSINRYYSTGKNSLVIEGSFLPAGIYIYKIFYGKQVESGKIIKSK